MIFSVFMHYSYTAAYFWCVLLAHYIFRAMTTSKLGEILGQVSPFASTVVGHQSVERIPSLSSVGMAFPRL